MTEAAATTHTDLKDTLEEMRASMAGQEAGAGLAGALQEALLALLSLLMKLLADFRAGKLVPPAPGPGDAGPAPCAARLDRAAAPARREGGNGAAQGWRGLWEWWWRRDAAAPDAACEEYGAPRFAVNSRSQWAVRAVAHPSASRIGPHYCRQEWEPVAGPSHRVEPGGNASLSLKGRGIRGPHELCASLRAQRFRTANRANTAALAAVGGIRAACDALSRRTNRDPRASSNCQIQKIWFSATGIGASNMFHYQNNLV
jgi:hypothetical protein